MPCFLFSQILDQVDRDELAPNPVRFIWWISVFQVIHSQYKPNRNVLPIAFISNCFERNLPCNFSSFEFIFSLSFARAIEGLAAQIFGPTTQTLLFVFMMGFGGAAPFGYGVTTTTLSAVYFANQTRTQEVQIAKNMVPCSASSERNKP